MSTENMRKLMQLTEGLDDNRNDDYCPTCHGWGEILPPDVEQDMDNIIPCPDCGPDDEYAPRLKTKDIKDLAFSMDESEDDGWEVEDFPVSESKGSNVKQVIRAVERVAEYYREDSDYYDDEFSDSDDAEYFNLIVKLIKSKQPERAAYKLDNLDSIVQETMQGLLSDEEQIALHKFVTSYGHNGFEHWDDVYYGLQEGKSDEYNVCGVCGEEFAWTGNPEDEMCDDCIKEYHGKEDINEAPSRKDFRMVADLIAKIEDPELRRSSAEDHAKMFAIQNPRFNKELFMKACNVSEQEAPELFPGTKDALGKLSIREDDPDDTDWDAHWAREDGDDERADDLEADAEWARMDDELDDIDEATSKFRLAEIVGKDGLAELLSDLRTGGVDYLALYFNKLYNHFLDEYSDEIPVGSRTGRPEDPEEYVQDNLERYHRAEIEQYWNTPDMDESLDEARYDPVEEVDGPCRWWAMCDNDATTTEPHPILGDVPICDRCVAKLRKIEGLDEDDNATNSKPVKESTLIELGLIGGFLGFVIAKGWPKVRWYLEKKQVKDVIAEFEKSVNAETIQKYKDDFEAQLKSTSPQSRNALMHRIRKVENILKKLAEFDKDRIGDDNDHMPIRVHILVRELDESMRAVEKFIKQSNTGHDRRKSKKKRVEEGDNERPYICVHAKHGKHECHANSSYGAAKKAAIHWGMRNTAGIDAHLADVSHSTQFVGEEDDGDVPSRRVDDAELTGVLLVKIESALNFIAKGMEDASRNGSSGPLDTKQRVIILRRQLKEIKAYLESGKKLVSIFGKVKLANESANDLADLSYDFDQVQMDIHDAENLLYLHLNGRPVAIDEAGYGDEWCDDCGQGRDQCRCSDYEGSEDWDECPHCHELTCTDDMCGLSEDLSLGSIVESILGEAQPRDYEMSDDELADEIEDETSEFERDSIDPEIEDEELGLRFD